MLQREKILAKPRRALVSPHRPLGSILTDRRRPVRGRRRGPCYAQSESRTKRVAVGLGSGLIDQSQKATAAAMQIAEK